MLTKDDFDADGVARKACFDSRCKSCPVSTDVCEECVAGYLVQKGECTSKLILCWNPNIGALLLTWIDLIRTWISNHMPNKVWDEITSQNVNDAIGNA